MVTPSTPSTSIDPSYTSHGGKQFRISGATVKDSIKDLPEDQQATLWWLSQYCHKHNLGREKLGALLKKPNGLDYYSADSITQLLGGGRIRRGENIEPMLEAIRNFRKLEDVRSEQADSGFIETRLFREIEGRCLRALKRQRITFIFGDSQIGKTASLKEVQRRHNHGQTVYVECPSTGSLTAFLKALGRQLNIPVSAKTGIGESVISTFDDRMLLIVDEAHNALVGRKNSNGSPVIRFLRELYNKARCGIVISMTNEGRDELLQGSHSKAYEQIWRRRIAPLQLPKMPFEDDLDLFSAAYGLAPATDDLVTISVSYLDAKGKEASQKMTASPLQLQRDQVATEGLGVWISILQDAADMAQEQRKKITWGAVLKAHCQAQADAEILQ